MRFFELHRDIDETGISGTGIVAEGVEFHDGTAALRWKSEFKSTAVYASMADVEAIHGHNGQTKIVWVGQPALDPDLDEAWRKWQAWFADYGNVAESNLQTNAPILELLELLGTHSPPHQQPLLHRDASSEGKAKDRIEVLRKRAEACPPSEGTNCALAACALLDELYRKFRFYLWRDT